MFSENKELKPFQIAEYRLTRQLTESRSVRRYALEVACEKDGTTIYITKFFDTDLRPEVYISLPIRKGVPHKWVCTLQQSFVDVVICVRTSSGWTGSTGRRENRPTWMSSININKRLLLTWRIRLVEICSLVMAACKISSSRTARMIKKTPAVASPKRSTRRTSSTTAWTSGTRRRHLKGIY